MSYPTPAPYQPIHPVRIVTSASLFDGHDAAINIMRRIMQSTGAEVIHLGHNRSVQEIVNCAIQEDAQGIAITSYQGGHVEYFKYMFDLLKEQGCGHIKIFGGGGGTILPTEIAELQAYGITRIYSPDDGMAMGLQGMINDVIKHCDFPTSRIPMPYLKLETGMDVEEDFLDSVVEEIEEKDARVLGRLISLAENDPEMASGLQSKLKEKLKNGHVPVLGITGTGGSGKSSLIDELVRRFLLHYEDATMALISVDPSKRKTGGALLGDRIRMNAINHPRIYMRSLATRQSNLALSKYVQDAINICKAAKFDLVIVETSGIGQSDTEIIEHSDVSLYVMTSEYGAATQLEKIDMLDFADVISINKFDKRGSEDALRDVRKQYKRNHNFWDTKDEDLPIIGSIASQFNDPGVNKLFGLLVEKVETKLGKKLGKENSLYLNLPENMGRSFIIPPDRSRYLAEIAELNRMYQDYVEEQASIARRLYQIGGTIEGVKEKRNKAEGDDALIKTLEELYAKTENELSGECRSVIQNYKYLVGKYKADQFVYKVRDKEIRQDLYSTTLSGLKIPKVAMPRFSDWGDILKWRFTENVPGKFPYAAGVFPLKREGEDPTRMFAGEGGPERTNKRFHYVSKGMPAKRLSTAFDSVTLYGEDPAHRPDIYGKIGNSGVSIATVEDAKKLYS